MNSSHVLNITYQQVSTSALNRDQQKKGVIYMLPIYSLITLYFAYFKSHTYINFMPNKWKECVAIMLGRQAARWLAAAGHTGAARPQAHLLRKRPRSHDRFIPIRTEIGRWQPPSVDACCRQSQRGLLGVRSVQ